MPFPACISFAAGQIAHVPEDAGSQVAVGDEQSALRLLAAVDGIAVRHVACVNAKPYGTITLAAQEAVVTRG